MKISPEAHNYQFRKRLAERRGELSQFVSSHAGMQDTNLVSGIENVIHTQQNAEITAAPMPQSPEWYMRPSKNTLEAIQRVAVASGLTF